MRELSTHELKLTVGGSLATGWVPASYHGVAIDEATLRSFAGGSIRIPGLIPGPVFMPGPATYRIGIPIGPDRMSEC